MRRQSPARFSEPLPISSSEALLQYLPILPSGFSFTTTITLALLCTEPDIDETELDGDPVLELPGFRIGKNGFEKKFENRLRAVTRSWLATAGAMTGNGKAMRLIANLLDQVQRR